MTRPLRLGAFVLLALSPLGAPAEAALQESSFGHYAGYTEPDFDGYRLESAYLTARDGTKLAIDVMRPTRDGYLHDEPLPAVWTNSRYHRRMMGVPINVALPYLRRVLSHGYVVAAAGVRGSGASFGVSRGLFLPVEAWDGYDVTEWLADQPWCDGNVGMFGASYLGMTQYMTAGTRPPHIKAIVPAVAGFDVYSLVYPGGIYRTDLMTSWGALVLTLDTQAPPVPVDGADGAELATAAQEAHAGNR